MLALSRSGGQAEALRCVSVRAHGARRGARPRALGGAPGARGRDPSTGRAVVVRRERSRASPASRTNLRTPLTSLIGRQTRARRARVRSCRRNRLVTLVGPGGVGKSRLAIEAARADGSTPGRSTCGSSSWPSHRPDEVVPGDHAGLDLATHRRTPRRTHRLIEFLRRGAAARARQLRAPRRRGGACRAGSARVAVRACGSGRRAAKGSRTGRGVVAGAAALARTTPSRSSSNAGSRRRPDATSATSPQRARDTLEDICSRLDGLPLAIELAAARLRAMPIDRARGRPRRPLPAAEPRRPHCAAPAADAARRRRLELRPVVRRRAARLRPAVGVRRELHLAAAARACAPTTRSPATTSPSSSPRLADKSLVPVESGRVEGYARCHMLQTLVDYGRDRLEASGDAERSYAAHRATTPTSPSQRRALRGDEQARLAPGGHRRTSRTCAPRSTPPLEDGDAETAQGIAGLPGLVLVVHRASARGRAVAAASPRVAANRVTGITVPRAPRGRRSRRLPGLCGGPRRTSRHRPVSPRHANGLAIDVFGGEFSAGGADALP